MLYVPRHLPNKLEYKVFKLYFSPLSVTDGKQRERNHPSLSAYSAGRAIWGIGAILVLYLGMLWVLVLGDRRSIRCGGGLDGCEQMCTLHAVFVLGVCLRETWTVWRIVPCVHKMYTLGRFHGLLETFLFAVD